MSLFSFLRKNKQESAPRANTGDDGYGNQHYTRSTDESGAARSRRRKKGNEPADPVLPEKKRARRRLIGAIALVLAAVIGLPMILDSEPKPLASDIAIQIPSKDKPAQPPANLRNAVPEAGVAASASLDPKEEVVDPAELAAPSSARNAATGEQPKEAAKPVKPVQSVTADKPAAPPKTEARVEAKPEHKPERKAEPKAEPKPEPKAEPKPEPKVAKHDDSARALALLEGKAEPKSSAPEKSQKFVIQVAALAARDKVNELQNKLKEAGIKSYTQKIATESGERIRIRVGPFASKDEADKVRARIVKIGLPGTIVPA